MTEPLQIALPGPQTLLGHLASTRGDVFSQAEVLCTLSLGWVLGRSERANLVFARMCGIEELLAWQPEDHTWGGAGRPDLVGRTEGTATPRVIVEAKLGAPLDESQLQAYQRDGCQLVLLVPRARVESTRRMLDEWAVEGEVVSWDQALTEVAAAVRGDPDTAADVAQLADLYRVVERSWIDPFSPEELERPAERIEDLVMLVDQTASVLTARYGFGSLPLHRRPNVEPRRYVIIDEAGSTPAIGVFLSVAGSVGSPLAMMIHRDSTQRSQELVERWERAGLPVVRSGGHAFLPLPVPVEAAHGDMLEACVDRAHDYISVLVDPPLPPRA